MTLIGDNYGMTDTEIGERWGMGEQNGNICNHDFDKDGQCTYCGYQDWQK